MIRGEGLRVGQYFSFQTSNIGSFGLFLEWCMLVWCFGCSEGALKVFQTRLRLCFGYSEGALKVFQTSLRLSNTIMLQ